MNNLTVNPNGEQKSAKVLHFKIPKKIVITKCSFCGGTLVKGKFIQSNETSPAICLQCVTICTDILKNDEEGVK